MITAAFLISLLIISTYAHSIPHESRVYDRDLSDAPHHKEKDFKSDEDNLFDESVEDDDDDDEDDDDDFEDHNHDTTYDHQAFLGKEEAKVFDQLTPEESKKRLIELVDEKIDADKDGLVSEDELRAWIDHTSKRYLINNRDNNWKNFPFFNAGIETNQSSQNLDTRLLSLQEYMQYTFGNTSEESHPDAESYKTMHVIIKRDERRWNKADVDGDSHLSKDEYLAFLHPEEFEHMRELVVQETMEDLDKNLDGFVDLEEFITDLWRPKPSEKEEPNWVTAERQSFTDRKDTNKDGKLDLAEVKDWILPKDYDHVIAETKHLMSHADKDHNKLLSKEEILGQYDLFVGSQATDFGDALKKHDEL